VGDGAEGRSGDVAGLLRWMAAEKRLEDSRGRSGREEKGASMEGDATDGMEEVRILPKSEGRRARAAAGLVGSLTS